jgi:hypothetical protein
MNWLGILVAAVMNMVVGFLWYSKWAFAPTWTKLAKIEGSSFSEGKFALAGAFGCSFVIAFFLDLFEAHMGVTTVADGMRVGLYAWAGFVATTQISSVLWLKKSFRMFLIDTGVKLLSFVIMGGILGA